MFARIVLLGLVAVLTTTCALQPAAHRAASSIVAATAVIP